MAELYPKRQPVMAGITLMLFLNAMTLITCQRIPIPSLRYSVTEGPDSQNFVANIGADSGILSTITPPALNNLQFKISSITGPQGTIATSRSPFVISEQALGNMRCNGVLDRDTICSGLVQCTISVDITALSPPDFFSIIKVNVTIVDINDNSPRFSHNSSSITIPETSPVGFRFTIPRATDMDSPQYGIQGYRVIDNPPEITLDVYRDDHMNIQPFIQLEQRLDRETRASYSLEIEAFDSTRESQANIAKLMLHIDVIDANDNAPYFSQAIYSRAVPEDYPLEELVIEVHALDHDHGDNALLTYSFEPATQMRYGQQFRLNQDTGDIFLTSRLDFEQQQSIELIVIATERNPNNIPATATVLIEVQDINDNNPVMTVESIAGTIDNIEIAENTGAGAFLAHISVLDSDSGPAGQVTCSLHGITSEMAGNSGANGGGHLLEGSMDSEVVNIFTLDEVLEGNYKLSTLANLDHEERSHYALEVVCSDEGEPPLTTTYSTTVTVLDVNDHTPQLVQEQFTVAIEENNAINVELVHLNATDPDSGRNSEVVYQVFSGPRNYINVDPYNGSVTARISFDYEQVQMLSYLIIAFDQGEPKKTATATVRINITDQNDRAPKFMLSYYFMSIAENQIPGTFVGQVEAVDEDSARFNEFLFEFIPDEANIVPETFSIDPYTGRIISKQVLDRERMDSYLLTVRAFDKQRPSLFSIINVTVIVEDTNDHVPIVHFPNALNNTVDFNPDSQKHSVTRINASDQDTGPNAQLSYQILTGDNEQAFYLDENSGILFVRDVEKLTVKARYTLNILVTDNGLSPLTNETWLYVNIVEDSAFLPSNVLILIIIGVVSGLIIIILLIAIIILKKRLFPASNKHCKGEQDRPDLHYTLQAPNGKTVLDSSIELYPKAAGAPSVTSWSCENGDQLTSGSLGSEEKLRLEPGSQAKGQQYQEVVYGCDADTCSVGSAEDSGRGSSQAGPTNTHNTSVEHDTSARMYGAPDLIETTWREPGDYRSIPRGGMVSFRSTPTPVPTPERSTAKVAPRVRYTDEQLQPDVTSARSTPIKMFENSVLSNSERTGSLRKYQAYPVYTYSSFRKGSHTLNSVNIDKSLPRNPKTYLESGC